MEPLMLRSCEHGPTLPRDLTADMALAQIGWLGHTGTVYSLDAPPNSTREPGGFGPLWICVGTWKDLGDGSWGIDD